jgi:hypothetical protein
MAWSFSKMLINIDANSPLLITIAASQPTKLFSQDYQIFPLEKNSEKLGSSQMQIFHLADCLAKSGMSHPSACPFCDQAQYILISCVFAQQA